MSRRIRRLSPTHEQAWRHYLRAQALLIRRLDSDLRAAQGITLTTYDALVQLSEAPGERLTMKALAEALVYTPSGLTRLVDALERAGHVERQVDPDNRRSTFVVLTADGRRALDEAWPVHVEGVRRYFAGHLSHDQARVVADVFGAIRGDLEVTDE